METWRLISTPEKLRLLEFLLRLQSPRIRVRETATAAKVSPGFVSRYLHLLEKGKVIMNGSVSFTNPRARAIKSFLNLERLSSAKIVGIVRKTIPEAKGIGVYGSWLSGTNDEKSDLDLWVKMRRRSDPAALARAARLCREALGGIEVELNQITDADIADLKGRGEPFYFSLFNSFPLWGESIG